MLKAGRSPNGMRLLERSDSDERSFRFGRFQLRPFLDISVNLIYLAELSHQPLRVKQGDAEPVHTTCMYSPLDAAKG
jgi:hypothetical protein